MHVSEPSRYNHTEMQSRPRFPIMLRTLAASICLLCLPFIQAKAQLKSVVDLPRQQHLPELMKMRNGTPIASLDQWQRRRVELKEILQHYQYGSMPPRPDRVRVDNVRRLDHESGKGTIESMDLVIESRQQPAPLRMRMLIFVPNKETRSPPFPVIIREEGTLNGNDFVPTLLDHGYVFIEYARHDLDPDKRDTIGEAQRAYPDHDWATLAVWAWGGMRVVDYLESRDDVDMRRIAITGHSRGGKMALLAGAMDDRIALVVPVQSGAGGAGSYTMLGPGGESLAMNDKPHWYADRLRSFIGHADRLPFDQHFLKALVAPRALLCIESVDDDYANPVGTQLTTLAAQPAYDLHGDEARDRNGLAYRNGPHAFNREDWQRLLAFAEWQFRGQRPLDPEFFQARPYDLPAGWYQPRNSETLAKGIESNRVAKDNQHQLNPEGFRLVDEAGNEAADDYFGMGRFGAVDYPFEMHARQVTNGEYVAFLNAVHQAPHSTVTLYHPDMAIERHQQQGRVHYSVHDHQRNRAVTHVSWFDAVRYCNWLHHGRPSEDAGTAITDTGAYSITKDGNVSQRQPHAKFALPTHDEWFKAAYYDRHGNYELYQTDAKGGLQVVSHPPGASSDYGIAGLYDRLWEWNENRVNGLFRSVRSGAWYVGNNRQAAGHLYANPDLRLPNIGIRIVRLK